MPGTGSLFPPDCSLYLDPKGRQNTCLLFLDVWCQRTFEVVQVFKVQIVCDSLGSNREYEHCPRHVSADRLGLTCCLLFLMEGPCRHYWSVLVPTVTAFMKLGCQKNVRCMTPPKIWFLSLAALLEVVGLSLDGVRGAHVEQLSERLKNFRSPKSRRQHGPKIGNIICTRPWPKSRYISFFFKSSEPQKSAT